MMTFLLKSNSYSFLVLADEIETAVDRVVSILHEVYKEDLVDFAFNPEKQILWIKWFNHDEFSNQEDIYTINPLTPGDIIIFTDYEHIKSVNPYSL